MPRKNQTTALPEGSAKAPAKARAKAAPVADPELIVPVRHRASSAVSDPEAEPTQVSTVKGLVRPYFKGLQILKAYHGRQLKYFVKMAEGMTCFMFQPGGDEEHMFVHLMAEPKVASMVPLAMGEKRGVAIQHVQLNGLRMSVIKGRVVSLPATVAEVLAESQNDTAEAIADAQAVNPFTGESASANLAYRDERELQALTR